MNPLDDPEYRDAMLMEVSETLNELDLLVQKVYSKAIRAPGDPGPGQRINSYPPRGELEASKSDNGGRL